MGQVSTRQLRPLVPGAAEVGGAGKALIAYSAETLPGLVEPRHHIALKAEEAGKEDLDAYGDRVV